MRMRFALLLALLGPSASAQEPPASDPPSPSPYYSGSILDRPRLTGDWFGARARLEDRGITLDVSSTQFYQGVTSGGLERTFAFGGRNDYFLHLNGEKLGLWMGILIDLHGETRYGESANFSTGALSPVNEFLLVPGADGTVSGLTAFKLTQFISENTLLFAGKINLMDEMVQPLTNATGLEGFQNTSLIFNPILVRTLPYSTFGAGIVHMKDGHPVLSISVFDTNDHSKTSVFDAFFNNGATVFGAAVLPTQFFGRPGHQGIEGAYSSGRYTNVSYTPYLDSVNALVFPGTPVAGSWAVGYLFDQAVWVSPENPKRMWGLFGKFGIADYNPNPLQWTATAGIAGASPIPYRHWDTFGIGYYYLGISGPLKQSARPLTPLTNEHGLELYYNARMTPWFQFTPDLQFIEPFQKSAASAVVFGLRAKVDF